MSIREDAEAFSLQVMDGSLPMGPATIIAWSFVMSSIISELCKDDVSPYRSRLAVATMERWGMVLPHTTVAPGQTNDHVRTFAGKDRIARLRALFHQSWHVATQVRIFRPLLEMDGHAHATTHERDENFIRELREFCESHTDEVDRLSREHDEITCRQDHLMALIGHLIKLMHVVLGDADMERFTQMYDEGTATLIQIRGLAQAPPQ